MKAANLHAIEVYRSDGKLSAMKYEQHNHFADTNMYTRNTN